MNPDFSACKAKHLLVVFFSPDLFAMGVMAGLGCQVLCTVYYTLSKQQDHSMHLEKRASWITAAVVVAQNSDL